MENTGFRAVSRRRNIRIMVILIILSATGGIVYAALTRGVELFKQRVENLKQPVSAEELWEAGLYGELAEAAGNLLYKDPIDTNALLYAGYSHYFLALSRPPGETRKQDLNASIRHLRQLLAIGNVPYPERIKYVLGKTYLEKGVYWADLAKRYLLAAYEEGYSPEDIFEYLGRTCAALGETENALEWYKEASKRHPTDRLLLALGEEAFKLGRYNDAEKYYVQAIAESHDDSLENRGLLQLGQLYYDVGNYPKAREVLERLVGRESNNVESLFLLAETCFEMNLLQEARQYWLAVVRLIPNHYDSLLRLYG